jgi:hypothetical protein
VWHHPRWLALAMVALMALGFLCWRLYLRSAARRDPEPTRPAPEI